ncbi:MAG: response regulator, partial [Desulfobacterales bacterium]|nr:response regulator [Desulfobacterales bacterium]
FAGAFGVSTRNIIGRTHADLYPEGAEHFVTDILEVFETGRAVLNKRGFIETPGGRIQISIDKIPNKDINGKVAGIIGFAQDVTKYEESIKEKKNLQDRITRAEKLEAISTLAGGIAHDFNNILGAILGYTQLIEMEVEPGSTAWKYIERILIASDRAKNLIQQILAFSRRSEPEKMPVDISIVIKEALKLLEASVPANIEFRRNVKSNLGAVLADQTQIHQVLMNLCTNALHAMENNDGMIKIALTPVDVGDDEIEAYHDIAPGSYLKLTVSDTGCGMPPETISRIFEPYYTTKAPGEGTGMGLASVHGVVKDHGGTILVESAPGEGSSFHAFFPVIKDDIQTENLDKETISSGDERVLFLDDEAPLVDIWDRMLSKLGYHVIGLTDPRDALDAFRANPYDFDIVITDMTMPGMTGEDFAREVIKIRPEIPVVLCTGFRKGFSEVNARAAGVKDFLLKPLTVMEMAQTIRKALDNQDL